MSGLIDEGAGARKWVIDEGADARRYAGYAQVLDSRGNVVYDGTADVESAHRADRDGAAWRAACVTGWTSPDTHPIPAYHGDKLGPPEDVAALMRAEWLRYVYTAEPLAHLRAITRDIDHLNDALAERTRTRSDAVTAARAKGASWSAIGDATGTSEQAASERWQ